MAPPWVRIQSFVDPSECRLPDIDLRVHPIVRGNFQLQITQVSLNQLRIGHFKQTIPQVSSVYVNPCRIAFGFLTDTTRAMQSGGAEILPGDIIVNHFDTLHQRTSYDHHSGGMSLPVEALDTLEAVVGHDLPERLQKSVIRPGPASMSRLLTLHKTVTQFAHDAQDLLEHPEICRSLEEKLIHALARCLGEGVGIEPTTAARRHRAIIARFEEFLAANLDRPLYLTEICAAVGVAERTLRACCEDHLGMGPVRYLTLRRMHLVRRALLEADASNTTVTRIITDHGFWELGRFSVAYRILFGESPSETLHRLQRETAVYLDRPLSLGRLARYPERASRVSILRRQERVVRTKACSPDSA
jgi:AraC-like DNA-binding protein